MGYKSRDKDFSAAGTTIENSALRRRIVSLVGQWMQQNVKTGPANLIEIHSYGTMGYLL